MGEERIRFSIGETSEDRVMVRRQPDGLYIEVTDADIVSGYTIAWERVPAFIAGLTQLYLERAPMRELEPDELDVEQAAREVMGDG